MTAPTLVQNVFVKIGQNTGILLLVNLAGAVMGFFMAAVLGRGLGDAGFGQYSFVLTWLLSLMLFTEFGLSTVLTRDIAAQPSQTHRYLITSIVAKTVLSLPAHLLLLCFAPFLASTQNAAVISALRWGVIFLYSGLIYSSFTAIFRAHQHMSPILWLTLSGQSTLLVGTFWLVWQQQPLFLIVAWAGLSQTGQCVLALIFYQRFRQSSHLPASEREGTIHGALIKKLLVRAWPFALAGILAALQLRANMLILAYLQGDQALGWYAAANRFVETGKQLPAAFYAAILPAMAALAGTQDAAQKLALQKTLSQSRLGLLVFSLMASLGAIFVGQWLLTLTYGPAYQPATPTLQILTLTLVPASQNSLLVLYLYACGDEKFVNLLTVVGLAANLGLCFWLIPLWGTAGVAVALLVAETILYVPYSLRAGKMKRETRG